MNYNAAVITVNNKCNIDDRLNTAASAVENMLSDAGFVVLYTGVVSAEREDIAAEIIKCCDDIKADIVITLGGTGFSKRDVTPEATRDVIQREVTSIPQAMLCYSLAITPRAMLTRATAGFKGDTMVINLPGSEKAAKENLGAVIDTLDHALKMLKDTGRE